MELEEEKIENEDLLTFLTKKGDPREDLREEEKQHGIQKNRGTENW